VTTPAETGAAPPLGPAAARGVRWNGIAALVTLASQLGQILVLARLLAPEDFGVAAVAVAVAVFATGFADLGLQHALVRHPHVTPQAWASAWWASVAAGLLLAALTAAAAAPLAAGLGIPALAPVAAAAAWMVPFAGVAAVAQARLQRDLRLRAAASVEIVASVLAFAAALAWVLVRPGPMALVAGQVVLVATRCVLNNLLSGLRPAPRLRASDLRPFRAFGAFQLGERALNHAAGNFDRLLVAALLGPAATGFYTMASQIALRPAALFGPFVARTLLPLLARLQGETARMGAAYLRTLSALSFLAAVVYALLFGLAEPFVRVVLGPDWEPVLPVLRVMAVLGYLVVVGNAIGNLTLALGRAGVNFTMNAVVLAGRVLAIIAGAAYGVTGVAAGMLAITILTLPFDVELPRRWLGARPSATFAALAWGVPPALFAVVVTLWVSWIPAHDLVRLLAAGAAGGGAFLVAARILAPHRFGAVRDELRRVFRRSGSDAPA